MEFHLLRETKEGSGQYEATGEVLRGSLEDAADECVRRTQAGAGRTAIYVFEALNKRPIELAPAAPTPAPPPPARSEQATPAPGEQEPAPEARTKQA